MDSASNADAMSFSADGNASELRVAFVKYLRPEMKFDGLEPLKAQMARDVAEAATLFGQMAL